MSHQFKPGDLALIIGAITEAGRDLIGRTVELVHKAPGGEHIRFDGRHWLAKGKDSWIVKGDGLITVFGDGRVAPSDVCLCAEENLMPLRGDFSPEQQKAKEVVA
ncbi:NfeD family protein [Pseudomonas idahonensis]|uniref:NfeD family protein n=1 Tax=Pseudomonas idahonensis TaxID=2942628 RepID=UPI0030D3AF32